MLHHSLAVHTGACLLCKPGLCMHAQLCKPGLCMHAQLCPVITHKSPDPCDPPPPFGALHASRRRYAAGDISPLV